MSASIDPENDTTTIAYRGALRMRWSRLAARADEIRAEIAARGFGEAAARSAAIEAARPELRVLLTEILGHAPLALLRTHGPRLHGWQTNVELFLASDSVLLGLIDGASPKPVWVRADAGDAHSDDTRWITWCTAWLGELRTHDANLATALAGATSNPSTAEAPARIQEASGIPAVVKQGLDLITWLSNGMAGAHEARRQRVAREADRQRPLLVDDVLASCGATIPRLDQMVGVLMKDPVECKRVADMIAGQIVADTGASTQTPPAAPNRPRARDFMPDAFLARMAAERAAAERAATERIAAERAAADRAAADRAAADRAAADRAAADRAAADHAAAQRAAKKAEGRHDVPHATEAPSTASPSTPTSAPSSTRIESPSDEAIDARLDALRLHIFTRQGDFEDRMSRAEQKLALVADLHEKAQRAVHSLREEFLRMKSSTPSETDAAETTKQSAVDTTTTDACPILDEQAAADADIDRADSPEGNNHLVECDDDSDDADTADNTGGPDIEDHVEEEEEDDTDADDTDADDDTGDTDDKTDDDSTDDSTGDDTDTADDDDDSADADAADNNRDPAPQQQTQTDFDAIFTELTAPASTPSPSAAAASPPPNVIRAAKLSALTAHFDVIADANDARIGAIERTVDIQLQNAIAILAVLEGHHVEP